MIDPQDRYILQKYPPGFSNDERLTVSQDLPGNDGKPHLIHFHYKVTDVKESSWKTMLSNQSLFVEIPEGILADGSKEGLLALLEHAEERMKVRYVFICFRKSREDRGHHPHASWCSQENEPGTEHQADDPAEDTVGGTLQDPGDKVRF